MKRNSIASLTTALAVIALVGGCKKSQQQGQTAAGKPKSAEAVKVEFFVMSQCPFGTQVVDAIKEVVDKMGPELDFRLEFIGNTSPQGELTSMHGPDEITGDIVQVCANKYAPANYLEMIVCQNKNAREVAKNWEKCAQDTKLPVEQIRACLNGPEGKELLKASFARAQARNANGSPTIFVADKPYEGRRSTNDFFRAICNAHKGATKPQACQNIPEPAKVNVTVLGDKRCTDCNTDRYVGMLQARLASPVIKTLDYSEPEGQKLYEELGGGNLPKLLFDESLDADKEASTMFSRGLRPVANSKYKNLEIGASWNPKCMNENGCSLDECKNTLACRKEVPNQLEVFVMSQCPFGVKALNAMEEVLKNFNNKIDFKVHFIANGDAKNGFQSLHGPEEVAENIRQLCAIKSYGKNYKYLDYILCRNKDIRSTSWESCAKDGIDAKNIKKCSEGEEGKKLHEEDIKVASALGVGGSPTWIANGKYKFSGIDAETVRRSICEHNKDLKGCENKLSGPEAGGGAPARCGAK